MEAVEFGTFISFLLKLTHPIGSVPPTEHTRLLGCQAP